MCIRLAQWCLCTNSILGFSGRVCSFNGIVIVRTEAWGFGWLERSRSRGGLRGLGFAQESLSIAQWGAVSAITLGHLSRAGSVSRRVAVVAVAPLHDPEP